MKFSGATAMLEASTFPTRLLQEHQYALIDRAALGNALFQIIPSTYPLHPIIPLGWENHAATFPALLELGKLTPDERTTLFVLLENAHCGQQRLPIVCLFKSAHTLEQLRYHWMQKIMVSTSQGQKIHLPSYTPGVFVQLQRLYTPAQFNALFGNLEAWSIYHDQAWHTLHASQHLSHHPADTRTVLSDALLTRMFRIPTINRVLKKLPQRPPQRPRYQAAAPNEYFTLSETIETLILRAHTHGLERVEEQVAFALHGLTIHPEFDRHPRIQQLLTTLNRQEQTYEDISALLQPQDWQQIRQELSATAF